jgi:hypothetical protein
MKMSILAKIRFLVACSIWKAKCTQEGTGTDITFTVTGSRNRSHLWIFSYTHKSNILEHCKRLVLHDKVIEGSLYHNQGDETAMAMGIQAFKLLIPVFATADNPLGRARAILSPFMCSMAEQLFTSVCNISSNFNGWPAIMQQTGTAKSSTQECWNPLISYPKGIPS